jgi:hypothetical protein
VLNERYAALNEMIESGCVGASFAERTEITVAHVVDNDLDDVGSRRHGEDCSGND